MRGVHERPIRLRRVMGRRDRQPVRGPDRGLHGRRSPRLGRAFGGRLRRRASRALSVFGALLALGLVGMMVLGAVAFFESKALERRGNLAAAQLAVLADAASAYAHSRFPALLAQTGGGPVELTLAALKADGALTGEFSEVDALGRGYRVLLLDAGTDAFDMLATETVAAADTVRPAAALLEGTGPRIGLAGGSRLTGPTVDADMGAFRAAFAGAPAEGALAALRRFDHGSVYGDALYRVAIPGFAEGNRMEADLDMAGNAIERAGRIEAAMLEVETDVEAGGDVTVTGDLVVGRAVRAAGTVEAATQMTAGVARIEGAVTSGSMTASGAVRAASLDAAGLVQGGSIGAAGAVAAGIARLGGLDAATVTGRTMTADTVSAASVTATRVQAGSNLSAANAGFSRLVVGRCQGCR